MMVGASFIFVENPKAASRSVSDALRHVADYDASSHVHSPDVPPTDKLIVGVVRHPFDRIVSGWRYFCRWRREVSLIAYLGMDSDDLLGVPFQHWPQGRWLDRCHVVLRFERLALEFRRVFGLDLPHMNTSDRGHYRDHFDTRTRRIVEKRFAADFARWGYSWL